MARTVTITGPRSLTAASEARLPKLFENYLGPFADPDAHFYLGGAVGIDTAAMDWLAGHTQASLTVVLPCTVADQPEVARTAIHLWQQRDRLTEVVELDAGKLDASSFHARNRWMVDHSGFVIGFPQGTHPSGGTLYTLDYATEQGKPRLVVPV